MRSLVAAVCILPLFFSPVNAVNDYTDETARELGLESLYDGLSDEERKISGEISYDGSMNVSGIMLRIAEAFTENIRQEADRTIGLAVSLCASALLCAAGKTACEDRTMGEYIEIIVCTSCVPLLAGSVQSLSACTCDALYRLSDYSQAALPAVFTAAAAGGAAGSAAVKFAAMSFAMEIMMKLAQTLVLPLVNCLLAMSIAGAIFPNQFLHAVSALVNKLCVLLMTLLCTLFTLYLSTAGVLSSAVDAAAVKTAKSLISTVLPVVGSVISDASSAILSAAGIIRACAGSFALAAVSIICLAPFAGMMLRLLMLRCAGAIAKCLPLPRLSALYTGMAQAISILMGLLGTCALMLFISIMSVIRAVSA